MESRDWSDGEQEGIEMYIMVWKGDLVHVMQWRRWITKVREVQRGKIM